MKSFLSMVMCLLLFKRFHRDEISSRDKLIPVKKTGMRCHLGIKNRCVTFHPAKFCNENVFTCLTHILNMISNFNMFELNGSYKQYVIGPFLKSEARKIIIITSFCKVYNKLEFIFCIYYYCKFHVLY